MMNLKYSNQDYFCRGSLIHIIDISNHLRLLANIIKTFKLWKKEIYARQQPNLFNFKITSTNFSAEWIEIILVHIMSKLEIKYNIHYKRCNNFSGNGKIHKATYKIYNNR
jgi:hypothetical protein